MNNIDALNELLSRIMDALENHFGPHCEVVLHDLTKEYDHTIVDIRNGQITGRKVGDCGSNLGLEVLRGTVKDGDRFNYITHTPDAKILRSSSVYFRDKDNRVIGALCINSDITETVRYEAYLQSMNNYSVESNPDDSEVFAKDVKQLLEHFLQEGQKRIGKPAMLMEISERLQFLQFLDKSGVFLITKSSERVCEFLGISRYTLYSSLDKIRNGTSCG